MSEFLRRVAKFYYTDSNLGFTINLYPYLFAGIFTIGSFLLLGWVLGFLEFDLARVLNDELGFGGGLSDYFDNYGTSFTSAGYDQLSGDPIALLQSQVVLTCKVQSVVITSLYIFSPGCRSTGPSCFSAWGRGVLWKLKFQQHQFLSDIWDKWHRLLPGRRSKLFQANRLLQLLPAIRRTASCRRWRFLQPDRSTNQWSLPTCLWRIHISSQWLLYRSGVCEILSLALKDL